MRNMKSQKGMTAIGWLLVLIIAGIFIIIGIKLVPVYIGGYSMYSAMETVERSPKYKGQSVRNIRKLMMVNFDVNYVTAVKPEDISIKRSGNGMEVNVSYEVVRPVLGNLSLLVEFDKTIRIE